MFGKLKKEKENVTIVTTKEQLKAAVDRKDVCIEIRGELVGKMKWMAKLSSKKIAIIITCLTTSVVVPAMTPAAGSAAFVAAGLGTTETASVIGVIGILGAVAVVGIFKNYDVELSAGDISLRLTAKK